MLPGIGKIKKAQAHFLRIMPQFEVNLARATDQLRKFQSVQPVRAPPERGKGR
jgi:hypothetical protein